MDEQNLQQGVGERMRIYCNNLSVTWGSSKVRTERCTKQEHRVVYIAKMKSKLQMLPDCLDCAKT